MSLLDYVNIKQGTKSTMRFSAGNTLPLTQLPFAMAAFTPQTDASRGTWFYHPDDRSLEGIRLTHQQGVWLGDYGALLFTLQQGEPNETVETAWSSYRPWESEMYPHYAKHTFQRACANFEVTPTERGGYIRLTYDSTEKNWLSIFPPLKGEYTYEFDPAKNRLIGSVEGSSSGGACNFVMHFIIQFDRQTKIGSVAFSDSHQNIHLQVSSKTAEAQIAISYISPEQALQNLHQDNKENFDNARDYAKEIWEEYLSRIIIETDTIEQKKTFYSCLYRVFLHPSKCYELDNGVAVHYSPIDGAIRKGKLYTNNVFWDTYRTVFPLFSIIAKNEYKEFVEGFVQLYRENGWLPRAPVMGETGCMPSTLIDGIIADGAVKGLINGELLETAFQGMLQHATTKAPRQSYGRNGVEEYVQYGYVPCDVYGQSVNLTLDAAYGDFCIAQVAKVLGRAEIEAEYRQRATNYQNLFDGKTGFMRGKDTNGQMRPHFNPIEWGGGDNCESSAWQGTFNVPHDIDGLTELFGGRDAMLEKLDALFAEPPHYTVGSYGKVIHEMAEMAAVDFGQCAISNQPSFHIPFLYAALDKQDKTDYWVNKICSELFASNTDGYPGDEDNGTMAAWYIFSSLGLYPICPGRPEFIKTNMLVTSAKIMGAHWDSAGHEKYISYL